VFKGLNKVPLFVIYCALTLSCNTGLSDVTRLQTHNSCPKLSTVHILDQ